jgi:hypothetical protein
MPGGCLVSYDTVRMLWWFLILACGGGAVVWAAIAVYVRVRQHMNSSDPAKRD